MKRSIQCSECQIRRCNESNVRDFRILTLVVIIIVVRIEYHIAFAILIVFVFILELDGDTYLAVAPNTGAFVR